jgi:hypothetical protein
MMNEICKECAPIEAREKNEHDAKVQQQRHAERTKLIASEHARIHEYVKNGLPCFLYMTHFMSIDSEIDGLNVDFPTLDDSAIRVAGLSGWRVRGVVPRTYGAALLNSVGMNKEWGAGVGGAVVGGYVLMELEVTAQNIHKIDDEIMEFLGETVE